MKTIKTRPNLLSFLIVVVSLSLFSCSGRKKTPIEELKLIGQKMQQNKTLEYSYYTKFYTSYSGDTISLEGRMYFTPNVQDTAIGMNFYNKTYVDKRLYSDSFYNGKYIISLMHADSTVRKKPLCDYRNGHMTAYPFLELSYGAIKLFLNDSAFYSNIDSLKRKNVSYKGKRYSSFTFWVDNELINTYKIGQKGRTKVKLIVRKSDFLPVFYSQHQIYKRKTHEDFVYSEAKFRKYLFDNNYPDSLFTIESIPKYYSWDKRFMKILTPETTAPEWKLPLIGGDSISLSELKGKFVLLDFWFIGCGSCIESIPTLNDLQSEYKDDGFVVIGINCFNEHKGKIEQYCKDREMRYLNVWKGDGITDEYKIKGAPIFYLINKDGKIVYSQVGHNSEKLIDAVKSILK